ncbi:hypothetical protein TNCV_5078731 [Trichonephila clavipes]|nr:hypothetical protein TNCV_5078731 [Trichonephila clavipes]
MGIHDNRRCHNGSLETCRAASPLVRLLEAEERWEAPDYRRGVLSQKWGGTESNRTVTCLVLKIMVYDRRTSGLLPR